jgi:hypothetical protein
MAAVKPNNEVLHGKGRSLPQTLEWIRVGGSVVPFDTDPENVWDLVLPNSI